MAVEKGKVLAELELKTKGKSLTKSFKDKLAAKWADKIESDDDIVAYIEDRMDILEEASGEADRRVSDALKASKAAGKKGDEGADSGDGKGKDDAGDENIPAWAKQMMEQNKTLQETITAMQQKEKVQSLHDRFKKHEKIKDIPAAFLKGRLPESEEAFEEAVEAAAQEFADFQAETGFAATPTERTPGKTTPRGGAAKVDADILEFAKLKNEEAKTAN